MASPHRRRIALAAVGAAALLLLGGGVAGIARAVAPPEVPPAYSDERPEPAHSGYISHSESVFIGVPPDRFAAWVDEPGRNLSDIVAAPRGMPAVATTHPLRGDWDPAGDRTGDRRRVTFADGHHLAEEVLADNPESFRYVIWGFTGYQRFAVRYAVAEFTYAERAGGTQLSWTYSFMPTTGLVRPFVSDFVNTTIAAMMRGTLEGMRAGAEQDQPG